MKKLLLAVPMLFILVVAGLHAQSQKTAYVFVFAESSEGKGLFVYSSVFTIRGPFHEYDSDEYALGQGVGGSVGSEIEYDFSAFLKANLDFEIFYPLSKHIVVKGYQTQGKAQRALNEAKGEARDRGEKLQVADYQYRE